MEDHIDSVKSVMFVEIFLRRNSTFENIYKRVVDVFWFLVKVFKISDMSPWWI